MSVKIKVSHYNAITLIIALSLFVAGRFGFFDILGLKRIFETLLFLPISLLGLSFLIFKPNVVANPFFLLPFSYLIFQLYWNPDILALADLSAAILIVVIILTLGIEFSDFLLRYTINIATLFAIFGLIEFFILLFNPGFVSKILLFYDNYSGSTIPLIKNFLQLLGLSDGTAYHLFGLRVTRLRSFASEPSLLVGYFLVPGALGITYHGKRTIYGLLCILFAICSLAGSVFAALFFSGLSLILLVLKSKRIVVFFPFVILFFFIWILNTHYNDILLMAKALGGDVDFLDKTNSANVRFSYIRDYAPKILSSPFGLSQEIHQPLGLILGSAARGGYMGGLFILYILAKMFASLGSLLKQYQLQFRQRLGLFIIYGSLITGILYLDNCFIQIYGFTLLLLIHNRLQQMKLTLLKTTRKSMQDHTRETR